MKRRIDPTVDCVFKAILGSRHHSRLLIHFLNAFLGYGKDERVVTVNILNPFNPKGTLDDKLSVVDIKAIDQHRREFQIGIQICAHKALPQRMLYTWSAMYKDRIKEGDDFTQLEPVISIWILQANLFEGSDLCHIPFGIYHPESGLNLSDHLGIHVVQLKNWNPGISVTNEKNRWLRFLKEGADIDFDAPPEWMNTDEMREAMSVLQSFSEEEKSYHLYQSRLDRQRLEIALKDETDARKADLLRERAAKERERAAKEQALAKAEEYRTLLIKAGIDPDAS